MGVRLLCPVYYFGYVANGRYFGQIYGVLLYVLYLAVFPYVIYKYINTRFLAVSVRCTAFYCVLGIMYPLAVRKRDRGRENTFSRFPCFGRVPSYLCRSRDANGSSSAVSVFVRVVCISLYLCGRVVC